METPYIYISLPFPLFSRTISPSSWAGVGPQWLKQQQFESHIIIATSLCKMGIFCKISFDERGWLKRYVYVQLKAFVVEYETFLFSSSTQRRGGIVRIGRQIFGRRDASSSRFCFDSFSIRCDENEYIYIEKRNIETCLFLKGRRGRKEGNRDKVYFNFKITCTIHAEKECTLRAKVRRIYLIKVFELKNV